MVSQTPTPMDPYEWVSQHQLTEGVMPVPPTMAAPELQSELIPLILEFDSTVAAVLREHADSRSPRVTRSLWQKAVDWCFEREAPKPKVIRYWSRDEERILEFTWTNEFGAIINFNYDRRRSSTPKVILVYFEDNGAAGGSRLFNGLSSRMMNDDRVTFRRGPKGTHFINITLP